MDDSTPLERVRALRRRYKKLSRRNQIWGTVFIVLDYLCQAEEIRQAQQARAQLIDHLETEEEPALIESSDDDDSSSVSLPDVVVATPSCTECNDLAADADADEESSSYELEIVQDKEEQPLLAKKKARKVKKGAQVGSWEVKRKTDPEKSQKERRKAEKAARKRVKKQTKRKGDAHARSRAGSVLRPAKSGPDATVSPGTADALRSQAKSPEPPQFEVNLYLRE